MAKLVTVHHSLFDGSFNHVADVKFDDEPTALAALEYAFRWTNNISGSWSRRDLPDNQDANPAVTVKATLPVDEKGNVWGLRSSMVGDVFVVDDIPYKVAVFGFDKVEVFWKDS